MAVHPSTSTDGARPSAGRPPQERYAFLAEHPQASSHGVTKRLTPVVPVLTGPQIPRRDRDGTRDRYSRAIATLFIPWRSVKDLCHVDETWCEAFVSRQGNISIASQQIIENIQLLHECKKDRDEHLQQVIADAQANDQVDHRLLPRSMRIDSDEDDDDADENETNLNFLDALSNNNTASVGSHLSEEEKTYVDEALRSLHAARRFPNFASKLLRFRVISLNNSC